MEAAVTFTAVEEQLFLRRYAEGYNLPDSKYISWLKVSYPEAVFVLNQTCLIIFLTLVLLMPLQCLTILPIVKQKQKNVLPLLMMPLPQGGKMKLVYTSSLSSENASSVSSKVQVTPPNVLSKYLVQYNIICTSISREEKSFRN